MRETKKGRKSGNSKVLINSVWHGPAMVVGKEGNTAIYVGWRGSTTKCAPEAVRRASTLEVISAEAWSEALQDVLENCNGNY